MPKRFIFASAIEWRIAQRYRAPRSIDTHFKLGQGIAESLRSAVKHWRRIQPAHPHRMLGRRVLHDRHHSSQTVACPQLRADLWSTSSGNEAHHSPLVAAPQRSSIGPASAESGFWINQVGEVGFRRRKRGQTVRTPVEFACLGSQCSECFVACNFATLSQYGTQHLGSDLSWRCQSDRRSISRSVAGSQDG